MFLCSGTPYSRSEFPDNISHKRTGSLYRRYFAQFDNTSDSVKIYAIRFIISLDINSIIGETKVGKRSGSIAEALYMGKQVNSME